MGAVCLMVAVTVYADQATAFTLTLPPYPRPPLANVSRQKKWRHLLFHCFLLAEVLSLLEKSAICLAHVNQMSTPL